MLKNCLKCNMNFNTIFFHDGKKQSSVNRKFCLICSPFKSYNGKKIIAEKNKKPQLYCLNCKNIILFTKGRKGKFCSNSCMQPYIYKKFIEEWLAGQKTGVTKDGKRGGISNYVRKYLIENRGEKCEECGWNKIHPITGKIPLQIDHINGNTFDARPENLKILCGSCHSLTLTFGILNKKR